MKYVALFAFCLLAACQEKEEESPSLESMVQAEEEWEFDTKDLAEHDPDFAQEILIQDEPEKALAENQTESIR